MFFKLVLIEPSASSIPQPVANRIRVGVIEPNEQNQYNYNKWHHLKFLYSGLRGTRASGYK